MSTKILVTGGAGFIGSTLVDALIANGYEVSVLDNLSSGFADNLNKNVSLYEFSINEKEKVTDLLKRQKFEYIFHLAAEPAVISSKEKALSEFKTTVNGILNLLTSNMENKPKKFIYFSSAAVYSQDATLPIAESSNLNPISYYGLSKFIGELLVKNLAKINKIPFVIFRPANVFGPRQRTDGEGGVVSSFIGQLNNNQNIKIFGNGKKTRDFIFVGDIVNACLIAIKKDISGVYNISTSKQTSIVDLAKQMQKIANKTVSIDFLNEREGEIQNSALYSQKIKQCGWLPKTNLEHGIITTWNYFNKQ